MRGKMFVIQILIAFVGSVTPLWAQSEAVIRGQLIADADGSVVPQGTVTLTAISTGTSTAAMADSIGVSRFRMCLRVSIASPEALRAFRIGIFASCSSRARFEP
jgi:hypothetical protein